MVDLRDAPIPEGFQPLSKPLICETVLGKRSGHVKGMGWGPKPSRSNTSGSTSVSSGPTQRELEQQEEINNLKAQYENIQKELQTSKQSAQKTIEEVNVLKDMVRHLVESHHLIDSQHMDTPNLDDST